MKRAIKFILVGVAILITALTLISTIYISSIMRDTKNVKFDKELIITASKQLEIFDSNNKLIKSGAYDGKEVVSISELQPHTLQSFISIEDKNFYKHNGLNYKRIIKAMLNNIKSRSFKEGASTISQQLIKNTHLSNEKTLTRKIKEMILTKKLENTFTKDEILETYLNVIYFGNGCYGIESASKFYFDKESKDLTIEESATLAGLIKAPTTYCPINKYNDSLKRRNLVLKEMYEDGYISDEEYYNISQKPINIINHKKDSTIDNLYLKSLKQEAEDILNLNIQQITARGYKIYTYFNHLSQESLENSLNNNQNYHTNSYGNIADSLGIIINNETCGIEAFYGKSIYDLTNLKRQPGSAIKPILVYAPALEYGEIYTCSPILDEKIDYNGYSPNNVGNIFHGYTSTKECVADSLNIPAIKIMDYVGIDKCKEFAKRAGISFNKYDNGYAIALGGFNEGTSLTKLVGSYIPFACNGKFISPTFIKKITTTDGVVIYNRDESKKNIMGDDTAYLMTDMLIEGVKTGTSKRLSSLPYQVAGKTGTVALKNSNLNSDVYSIAYTTEHIVGIWLGNYSFDNQYNLESSNNGGTYCTNFVKDTLNGIYKDHLPQNFSKPSSVVELKIDEKNLIENHTVKLASSNCPERYQISELFSTRYQPTEYSNIFNNFDFDFNVELTNNIANITISAKDYLNYDIYVDNNLIKSINNQSGIITFDYDKLLPNKMYTFYVDVYCDYSDAVQKSKEISVYTKNIYENLIEYNPIKHNASNNLSWYFQ